MKASAAQYIAASLKNNTTHAEQIALYLSKLDEMEQRLREHQTKLGIFAKPPSAENDRIAEENPLEWTDEQIAIWNLFIECLLQLGAINDDNDNGRLVLYSFN